MTMITALSTSRSSPCCIPSTLTYQEKLDKLMTGDFEYHVLPPAEYINYPDSIMIAWVDAYGVWGEQA